jgi:hypothetical protein
MMSEKRYLIIEAVTRKERFPTHTWKLEAAVGYEVEIIGLSGHRRLVRGL